MAIQYKMIERVNPHKTGNDKRELYPQLVRHNKIDYTDFCRLLREKAPFCNADIIRFLYSMQAVLKEQLLQGNSVEIKALGYFYPSMHYKGKPNAKRIKPQDMEINIAFRPYLDLKREMNKGTFVKVKDK